MLFMLPDIVHTCSCYLNVELKYKKAYPPNPLKVCQPEVFFSKPTTSID